MKQIQRSPTSGSLKPGLRVVALSAALAGLTLSACTANGDVDATDPAVREEPSISEPTLQEESSEPDASVIQLEEMVASPRQDVPSALRDPQNEALPAATIDRNDLLRGGPPPDGIPAIDSPKFQRADSVQWLQPGEPVIALKTESGARAYPVQILMWHEIVNDVADSRPIAVTYCPLCNTALAFDRRVDDLIVDFGVSGLLFNSDLVMFDRQTESLWPQIEGEAVAGVLTGTELDRIPVQTISWQTFLDQHPDGWVLSRETGFNRDYGRNPYVGYDAPGSRPLFPTTGDDARLEAKTRIIGVETADGSIALPWDETRNAGAVNLDIDPGTGDAGIVVWVVGETNSALDSADISEGRPIGMSGVFESQAAGQDLTFIVTDGQIIDEQSGSRWSATGEAIEGPLAGEQLIPVAHVDTFWFAWVAFHPDVVLL